MSSSEVGSGSDRWREGVAFQHAQVKRVELAGKGRALVASGAALPAGTPLLRERPLVVAAANDAEALAIMAATVEEDSQSGHPGRFSSLCRLPPKNTAPPVPCSRAVAHQDEDGASPSTMAAEQVRANAFGGRKSDGSAVTLSLFSAISNCNHSCVPNAALSRQEPSQGCGPTGTAMLGGARTLYAIHDIADGEEICICYDSDLLWLPEPVRKLHLSTVWSFQCDCRRCTNDRQTPDLDSFTGIERYYDGFGKLTSGVRMQPAASASDDLPCVSDIYEEACQMYGPSHWRTHVARNMALRVQLKQAPHEFDFELFLEHLQETQKLMPASHPHFLALVAQMNEIAEHNAEVMDVADWREIILETRMAVGTLPQDVLRWNGQDM